MKRTAIEAEGVGCSNHFILLYWNDDLHIYDLDFKFLTSVYLGSADVIDGELYVHSQNKLYHVTPQFDEDTPNKKEEIAEGAKRIKRNLVARIGVEVEWLRECPFEEGKMTIYRYATPTIVSKESKMAKKILKQYSTKHIDGLGWPYSGWYVDHATFDGKEFTPEYTVFYDIEVVAMPPDVQPISKDLFIYEGQIYRRNRVSDFVVPKFSKEDKIRETALYSKSWDGIILFPPKSEEERLQLVEEGEREEEERAKHHKTQVLLSPLWKDFTLWRPGTSYLEHHGYTVIGGETVTIVIDPKGEERIIDIPRLVPLMIRDHQLYAYTLDEYHGFLYRIDL